MTPFSESSMAAAMRKIDSALAILEEHADTSECDQNPALIGEAYADIRQARGILCAVLQLEQIEAEMGKAPTERPSTLRLVR